jgi:plastocyanin
MRKPVTAGERTNYVNPRKAPAFVRFGEAPHLLSHRHPVPWRTSRNAKTWKLALAMAGALIAASCGSSGGGGSTPTSPTTPPAGGGGGGAATNVTITITGQGGTLAFTPNPATIAPGQMVVFKNNDTVAHHVMLDDGTVQTPDIRAGRDERAGRDGERRRQHVSLHHPSRHGRRLQRGRRGAPAELQPGPTASAADRAFTMKNSIGQ